MNDAFAVELGKLKTEVITRNEAKYEHGAKREKTDIGAKRVKTSSVQLMVQETVLDVVCPPSFVAIPLTLIRPSSPEDQKISHSEWVEVVGMFFVVVK